MVSASQASLSQQPLWRRVFRWWFAIEPMRHAWWETFVMRGIIAWAAYLSIENPSNKTSQPQPHGLAAWGADFTWLGDASSYPSVRLLCVLCLGFYVLSDLEIARCIRNLRDRLRGSWKWLKPVLLVLWLPAWVIEKVARVLPPVLALLPPLVISIGHGVLGNSNGAIGHTTQILTVALLAQWLAYVWACVQPRTSLPMPHGFDRPQLAADWARQAVAATYVVSAISKLIDSKGDWISDTPYFGLQVTKSTGMGFYDHLVPRIDAQTAWMSQWFVDHPIAATFILGAALPLELFAFLALNNRRIALIFGLALYAFHSSITEVMQLGFLYHKVLLLALFINPVWWVVTWIGGLLPARKGKIRVTKSE